MMTICCIDYIYTIRITSTADDSRLLLILWKPRKVKRREQRQDEKGTHCVVYVETGRDRSTGLDEEKVRRGSWLTQFSLSPTASLGEIEQRQRLHVINRKSIGV